MFLFDGGRGVGELIIDIWYARFSYEGRDEMGGHFRCDHDGVVLVWIGMRDTMAFWRDALCFSSLLLSKKEYHIETKEI